MAAIFQKFAPRTFFIVCNFRWKLALRVHCVAKLRKKSNRKLSK